MTEMADTNGKIAEFCRGIYRHITSINEIIQLCIGPTNKIYTSKVYTITRGIFHEKKTNTIMLKN